MGSVLHPASAYPRLTVVYVGGELMLGNLWVLVFLVPVLMIMDRWVLPKEERYLTQRFGEAYSQYCAAVRRWF
jgi:protein-S-isoprenylcysteine O-methyltransferase Ste14